ELRPRFLPGGCRRADRPDPRFPRERLQRTSNRRVRGVTTATATQRKPFVGELLGRSDYAIIGEIVEPNTVVLDLGCGDGELLEWLAENKGVDARGVEMSAPTLHDAIASDLTIYVDESIHLNAE